MSTFTDMVLARRKRSWALEAKASASITRALSSVATEAKRQLARMNAGFAPDGHFIDTASARRAAQAAIADVKDTIKSATAKSGLILSGVNETAFNQSLLDANYAIESATGLNADMGASFNQIFQQAAYQARTREVMDVSPIRAFTGTGAWMEDRYRETFMEAVVNGEAVQSTSNKLRKISGITDRAAQRITRTNVQAAMNDAHRLVYESNDDLFDGFIWVSTLDELTSQICAALDGKFFPLGSSPPGPPAHPNCRSVLVGHFRDPDLQAEQETDERRARQFGPDGSRYQPDSGSLVGTELIPADTTYDEWLRQQHPAVTRQVTGSRLRDELWRNGSLQLEELVNPLMEPITDAQAARRVASKFPANAHYQELAAKYGQTPVDWKTILKEDRAMVKSGAHTQPRTLKPKKKPTPPGPQPLTEAEKLALDAQNAAKKAKADDIVETGKDASAARIQDSVPEIPDEYRLPIKGLDAQKVLEQHLADPDDMKVIQAILKGEDPYKAARAVKSYTAAEVEELKRVAFSVQYQADTQALDVTVAHRAEQMDLTALKARFTPGSTISLDDLTEVMTSVPHAQALTGIPTAPNTVRVTYRYVSKDGNGLTGVHLDNKRMLGRGQRFRVGNVVDMGNNEYAVELHALDSRKELSFTLKQFNKAERDIIDDLDLGHTGITKAEYNALKKEFDDLLVWKKDMLTKNPAPPPPFTRQPTLKGAAWKREAWGKWMNETRFNKATANAEASQAARAKLAIYRAKQELEALGLMDELINNPHQVMVRLRQALKGLNAHPEKGALIDKLVDRMKRDLGNKYTAAQIQELGDAMKDVLEIVPMNVLSTTRVQELRWLKSARRSHFDPNDNKINLGMPDPATLVHEFMHALEHHNSFGPVMVGQRDSYFAKSLTQSFKMMRKNEWSMNQGNVWSDYAARVYFKTIEAREWTEIMSMIGERFSLHGIPGMMIKMNPELIQLFWAAMRNKVL